MLKFCWKYLKSLIVYFSIFIILNITVVLISLYLIYFGGKFVDTLINILTFDKISEFIVLYLMLSIVLLGLNYFARRVERVVQLKMNGSMIKETLNHVSRISSIITNKTDPVTLNQHINIGILFSLLIAFDIIIFTENSEKMFAMSIVSCVMLFFGIIFSKLPYSKHTGLRLPWTVQDKETWSIAHRIIEYISLPIVLLYIACTLSIDNFEFVTLVAMLVWIGIPAIISYIFFKQKIYGQ